MVNDKISDMLTRIRNANLARHNSTFVFYCKSNLEILEIFFKEGYIESYSYDEQVDLRPIIKIVLKYKGWWIKKPVFSQIKRISRPGKRIYSSYLDFEKRIDNLKHGNGIAIISTSTGIMSHIKAIKYKKGGEILCYIE